MIATTATLGDIAASHPAATLVFLRHRLDFCCGGGRSLAEACEEAHLDAAQVVSEIEEEDARGDEPTRWQDQPLEALADHIEAHYHAALRRDVPPLLEAARKVERVHAGKPAVPVGLAAVLDDFWSEMQDHMQKEELALFPMIRNGARGAAVAMPVRMMEQEHDDHGQNLRRIREVTGDLQVPEHACPTWTALYHGLARLEQELMQHIHLENHVLFPRAASPA